MVKRTKRRNNRKSILQKRISRKRLSRKRLSRKRLSRKRTSRKRISKRKMMRGGGIVEAKERAVGLGLVTEGKAEGLQTDEFISQCLRKIRDYEANKELIPELEEESTEYINKWTSVLKGFKLDEVADHKERKERDTAIKYILLHNDAVARLDVEKLQEIFSKLNAYDMKYSGEIIKSLRDDGVFEMPPKEKVKHILKQLFTEFYRLGGEAQAEGIHLRTRKTRRKNIGEHIQDLSEYLDNEDILNAMKSAEQGVAESGIPRDELDRKVDELGKLGFSREERREALIMTNGGMREAGQLLMRNRGVRSGVRGARSGVEECVECRRHPQQPQQPAKGGVGALEKKIEEKEATLALLQEMGEDTSVVVSEIKELREESSGPFPEPEPEPEEPEPVEEGGYAYIKSQNPGSKVSVMEPLKPKTIRIDLLGKNVELEDGYIVKKLTLNEYNKILPSREIKKDVFESPKYDGLTLVIYMVGGPAIIIGCVETRHLEDISGIDMSFENIGGKMPIIAEEQPRLGRSPDNEIDEQVRQLSEIYEIPEYKTRVALMRNGYDMDRAANYLLENADKGLLFWRAN